MFEYIAMWTYIHFYLFFALYFLSILLDQSRPLALCIWWLSVFFPVYCYLLNLHFVNKIYLKKTTTTKKPQTCHLFEKDHVCLCFQGSISSVVNKTCKDRPVSLLTRYATMSLSFVWREGSFSSSGVNNSFSSESPLLARPVKRNIKSESSHVKVWNDKVEHWFDKLSSWSTSD